ncbi:MAG: pentapeptide repeat-containing protein, partial [Chloroflexi bacterium]|nr:pentapeptide repeat-containing protein [Chloroflexota bacterium]
MSNPDHVAVAKGGTYSIARWRERHFRRRERLDLSGAYLSGARLPSVDLAYDDLSGADLTSADLRRSNLTGANLRGAHLSRSQMAWSQLQHANMQGVSLGRADLTGSCLREASLKGADLSYAELPFADLREADLSGADLSEANLAMADLTGASLNGARLHGTILDVANLTGVDLRRATLVRPLLGRSLFCRARFEMTLFADCDLSQALELESAFHAGPSIIGLDTLARSRGLIPEHFLRRAGVPESLIGVQTQLAAAEDRSCRTLLIASIKDSGLSERLMADLWRVGLPTWQLMVDDEEELLGDGELTQEQRLTLFDNRVLLCSEDSLASPRGWRIFELAAQNKGSEVASQPAVIPLNLDNQLLVR